MQGPRSVFAERDYFAEQIDEPWKGYWKESDMNPTKGEKDFTKMYLKEMREFNKCHLQLLT